MMALLKLYPNCLAPISDILLFSPSLPLIPPLSLQSERLNTILLSNCTPIPSLTNPSHPSTGSSRLSSSPSPLLPG
ncbi:hypothetical protein FRC02_007035 [Tulasnella sp. 418]|nr:hypothetical protein FRC02_007035 [Tulasnella sp. 418]